VSSLALTLSLFITRASLARIGVVGYTIGTPVGVALVGVFKSMMA